MAAHRLSRWQKASAIVPMAVLVGAWGAALTNTGFATAADDINASSVPDVPSTPFDQPASVQSSPTPSGIDSKAGTVNALSTLSTSGIPSASLLAYRRAETLLGKADPTCNLEWPLIAAIGRVESNHGRTGGNSVNADGVSTPGIFGVPLDGSGSVAAIKDTDNGRIDDDPVWDRAVGPMQFIPGTWQSVAVDADGDNEKNAQDIDDAATAAGVYLCSGSGDLSTQADTRSAVHRYNHSNDYVDLVMTIADQYAKGQFTPAANGYSTSPVLTTRDNDQTLSFSQRTQAQDQRAKAEKKTKKGTSNSDGNPNTPGSTSTPPQSSGPNPDKNGSNSPGTSSGSTPGSTAGVDTGLKPKSGGTVGGAVQDAVKDTPLAPVTKPVTGLLTMTQAILQCGLKFPFGPKSSYDACVYDLTH